MSRYTDNYDRGSTHGIIAFWLRNDYDHGRFFDREISHYETELAKANLENTKRLGEIWTLLDKKQGDLGTVIPKAIHATREFRDLLAYTMDKSLHCAVIISTPVSLLDHMIREAEESIRIFKMIEDGGGKYTPSDAIIHESTFWLRQMEDHLGYILHYLDLSNYELRHQVAQMMEKFRRYRLQALDLQTMIRPPRTETLPVLKQYRDMIIPEVQNLEEFKLELSELIKKCAAITTAPPDLLEHVAREAHHLWKNLEQEIIT